MDHGVETSIRDGIAHVRLNRPEKMNALNAAMFSAVIDVGERLKSACDVRAVILSGAGRAFCAGLDLDNFGEMAAGRRKGGLEQAESSRTAAGANRVQQAAMVWREIPVPVIAALHGIAFGGGLQIALGADLRLVAADTKMAFLEINWGLVPDMAGIVMLRRLVRDDVARELIFSGRVFTGAEAATLGLATRICENPVAEAHGLAAQIAAKSPDAIRASKHLINLAADADTATILTAEANAQDRLIGSKNQIEAARAGLEKRIARFEDPLP